ncbi:MAG: NAD-dependent epimerase/dehydratase family protein [Halodesulfurarchaeum sp.]
MRVFVTGATGFIGSRLVRELLTRGEDVVLLTRDPDRAAELPEEVTVAQGDVTEKESMRDPMRGADQVYHIAAWYRIGPGPENTELARAINVDGTRNVLELLDELDVTKGVYTSTVATYGDTGGEVVDESYQANLEDLPTVYQRTKWRAHHRVAEPMMENGLPISIATLGGIYGPGEKATGGTVRAGVKRYLEGDLPMIPREFTIPWEHVDDTVTSLVRTMEHGEPGEEYIIGGDQRPMTAVFDIAEEITGVSTPTPVPAAVFRGLASIVGAVEQVYTPAEGLRMENLAFFGNGRIRLDTSKANRELDLDQRSLETGLEQYLEWELEQLDPTEAAPPISDETGGTEPASRPSGNGRSGGNGGRR